MMTVTTLTIVQRKMLRKKLLNRFHKKNCLVKREEELPQRVALKRERLLLRSSLRRMKSRLQYKPRNL